MSGHRAPFPWFGGKSLASPLILDAMKAWLWKQAPLTSLSISCYRARPLMGSEAA
jgi:hypothetical protein